MDESQTFVRVVRVHVRLQFWRGKSSGVAKRPRSWASFPPEMLRFATFASLYGGFGGHRSGTSGESPREGVCLTHGNLMHQLGTLGVVIGQPQPGDTAVSMLPPWHIYERTTTYFRCVCAMRSVYRYLRRSLQVPVRGA
jgi:acyl-CoA synthetase (AMP-forming)/AMP-acid ligase II